MMMMMYLLSTMKRKVKPVIKIRRSKKHAAAVGSSARHGRHHASRYKVQGSRADEEVNRSSIEICKGQTAVVEESKVLVLT